MKKEIKTIEDVKKLNNEELFDYILNWYDDLTEKRVDCVLVKNEFLRRLESVNNIKAELKSFLNRFDNETLEWDEVIQTLDKIINL